MVILKFEMNQTYRTQVMWPARLVSRHQDEDDNEDDDNEDDDNGNHNGSTIPQYDLQQAVV